MNCKEIIIFLVLSYQPKTTAYHFMETAALAVFFQIPQSYLHNLAHKRQTEQFSRHLQRTS